MKVQWTISDSAIDWCRKAAAIYGSEPGYLITQLVRYHAGNLESWEQAGFEEFLEVVANSVSFERQEEE